MPKRQHWNENKSHKTYEFTDCTISENRIFHWCRRCSQAPLDLVWWILATHQPREAGEPQGSSTRTTELGNETEILGGLPTHTSAKGKMKARIQSKSWDSGQAQCKQNKWYSDGVVLTPNYFRFLSVPWTSLYLCQKPNSRERAGVSDSSQGNCITPKFNLQIYLELFSGIKKLKNYLKVSNG